MTLTLTMGQLEGQRSYKSKELMTLHNDAKYESNPSKGWGDIADQKTFNKTLTLEGVLAFQ